MSLSPRFGSSRSVTGRVVRPGCRPLLVASTAAAAVVLAGGCAARPQPVDPAQAQVSAQPPKQPVMRSTIANPPEATLVQEPAAVTSAQPQPSPRPSPQGKQPAPDPAASPAEAKASRQAAVEHLLNEAMTPPPQPPAGPARALGVADRAVAPLADTLAAIDAAQRAVVENLRNVETAGFKASRTACGDGRDVSSQLDLAQGELQPTGRALDVGVQGDGFLQVQAYTPDHPNGTVGFTRTGRLYVAKDGNLVVGHGEGYQLIPPLKVPVGTTELRVEQDGSIRATRSGTPKTTAEVVGRLTLARFTDPTALRPLGGGLYAETEASGHAVDSFPAERGAGSIVQGFVEASNVDLIRERMRLRFLQNWRAAILAAFEGEASAEPAAAVAPLPSGSRGRRPMDPAEAR